MYHPIGTPIKSIIDDCGGHIEPSWSDFVREDLLWGTACGMRLVIQDYRRRD